MLIHDFSHGFGMEYSMGNLILCRTKTAKNPFRINSLNLNIYSLEELCYYIYHNIYLIGMDFVHTGLIDFIRDETGEKELADRLLLLLEKEAGLSEIIVTILKYVDYYSVSEIEEIRELLESLNTQNIYERLKLRADSFLANRCYFSAVANYRKIADAKRDPSLMGSFYAKVYHNMGTAYGKMFLYRQAAECFDGAYRIGQHEESKKCSIVARILAKTMENADVEAALTEEEREEVYVTRREIETLMDNARYSNEFRELEAISSIKEGGNVAEYYRELDSVLEEWKKEYSKFTA